MKSRMATVLLLLGRLLGITPAVAQQPADTLDQAIDLGSQAEDLGEIDRLPLQITGFGVGDYSYAGRTGDNSFSASKVGVALFREITSHAYVFGQLTTALVEPVGGGEPGTEVEIDNLLLSVVPPGASNVGLTFGKSISQSGSSGTTNPQIPGRPSSLDCPAVKMVDSGQLAAQPRLGLEAFCSGGDTTGSQSGRWVARGGVASRGQA